MDLGKVLPAVGRTPGGCSLRGFWVGILRLLESECQQPEVPLWRTCGCPTKRPSRQLGNIGGNSVESASFASEVVAGAVDPDVSHLNGVVGLI